MLNKLSVSAVGILLLETPAACADTTPGATRRPATATTPAAGHRLRATATSAFAPTRMGESVALTAIWVAVAVLFVVGIASLFAPVAA